MASAIEFKGLARHMLTGKNKVAGVDHFLLAGHCAQNRFFARFLTVGIVIAVVEHDKRGGNTVYLDVGGELLGKR